MVNSEGIHHGIWQQVLAGYGLELTDAEYKAYFFGVLIKESAVALVQRRSIAVDEAQLLVQKEALTKAYLQQQAFPLMPRASEAVAAAQAVMLKLGIVTWAGPDGLQATLRCYGWFRSFHVTVSADDVQSAANLHLTRLCWRYLSWGYKPKKQLLLKTLRQACNQPALRA